MAKTTLILMPIQATDFKRLWVRWVAQSSKYFMTKDLLDQPGKAEMQEKEMSSTVVLLIIAKKTIFFGNPVFSFLCSSVGTFFKMRQHFFGITVQKKI
jgi:hypothetical protein